MDPVVLLDGELEIVAHDTFVLVKHSRSARDLGELQGVLDAIDHALQATGHRHVMFDSRRSDRTPQPIQDAIWAWMTEHPTIARVATLVESPRLALSVRMTGLSKRVKIKAFHDVREAAAWLA